MWQVILTGIFYVWMFLVLILLWRQSINFHARMQDLQHALINISQQNADSAQKAADAAFILAKRLEKS
jgi:hypothetical protein